MSIRALRAILSFLLTTMLVVAATAAPALAAKSDKKKDKQPPEPAGVIQVLKGDKFRMANSRMANQVVRIEDAVGDQVTSTGAIAADAPDYSDMVATYVASTKVPSKLLAKMAKEFPAGTVGSFYGSDAAWTPGDPAIFVAATLAGKRPADALGQQLEVAIDGNAATPLQVASAGDPYSGVERFSLSGIFNNGAWTSGTTDVSGREPGGEIEWYNAASGNFGFYDAKRSTFFVILPRPGDARSVTVALRTTTPEGEVIDRLELPDGGAFIDLTDPSGGFSAKAGLDPLSCRALETFGGSSTEPAPVDPDATLIRYTAGVRTDEVDFAAGLLAPALDTVGPMPMEVTDLDSAADVVEVDADLAVVPGGNAITLTMEVPAGHWSFTPAEGAQVKLANGEPLIDHSSLTGMGGVLTGPGLDGVVAGDPSCSPVGDGSGSEPGPEGSPAAPASYLAPETSAEASPTDAEG